MWKENLVIIVKVGIPVTKVRETPTQQQTSPSLQTGSSRRGLQGWGRRPGTRRLRLARRLGWGKRVGTLRPTWSGKHEPGPWPTRSAPRPWIPWAERPSGCAPGLPIPRGLRRSVLTVPRPGPSSSSNPHSPPRPAPVNPGRPPPGRPPLPPPSRHPALLTCLSPPHSGRSLSSHSATLPFSPSASVQFPGPGLNLNRYSRFGGVEHRGLPITRRRASPPGRKACWEVQCCPPPSPHLAPRKSLSCLYAKFCSRTLRKACEAGAAISEQGKTADLRLKETEEIN